MMFAKRFSFISLSLHDDATLTSAAAAAASAVQVSGDVNSAGK